MGYLSPLTHFKKQKSWLHFYKGKHVLCFKSTFGNNICDSKLCEYGLCGLSIYISEIFQKQSFLNIKIYFKKWYVHFLTQMFIVNDADTV